MPALKSEKRELFAHGLAKGLTKTQAALNAGFSAKGAQTEGSRLSGNPEVLLRVEELIAKVGSAKAKVEELILASAGCEIAPGTRPTAFVMAEVRERQYRLTILQDVVDRVRMLIEERAAHGRALPEDQQAPGVTTGLLVRTQRNVRRGNKIVIVDEWKFDGAVLSELRDTLKHAAVEVGDWEEKHQVKQTEGPDVSHLTPAQLFEEQRILRETKDRLEALRAGQPDPMILQVTAGSVQYVASQNANRDSGGFVEAGVVDADLVDANGHSDGNA